MTCHQCQNLLVEYSENLLESGVRTQIQWHLNHCPACQERSAGLATLVAQLHRAGGAARREAAASPVAYPVMERLPKRPSFTFNWRSVMKLAVPLSFAAAAATFLIVTFVWHDGSSRASAQEVLADAAAAMQNTTNLHIEARMRTAPADNPGYISLDADFVPIEIDKRASTTDQLQWRFEKPGRILVMDGKNLREYIKPIQVAVLFPFRGIGDLDWMEGLLNIGDTLHNEQQAAATSGAQTKLTQETSADGRQITVLTIETKSMPLHGNEWARNQFLGTSDTKRVYRFDAQTKQLEGLQIWVHPKDRDDVLIFETTKVDYPDQIPDSRFTIDLPDGVQWQQFEAASTQPVPPEFSKDRKPDEVARDFFQTLSAGDKEHFQDFWQIKMQLPDQIFNACKDLKILSIGKPVQGMSSRQWLVPYKIQFTNGETKDFRLSLRNDNVAQRWYVDGGF